jgi:D-aminoacyl-tRNA deacylase
MASLVSSGLSRYSILQDPRTTTLSGLPSLCMGYITLLVFNVSMRALLQRVSKAVVTVDGSVTGRIERGLVVFLGIRQGDTRAEAEHLAQKIVRLRIFPDAHGRMNVSLADVAGQLLIVSQFTLYADVSRGNRPSYTAAAPPEIAEPLYQAFVEACRAQGMYVATGIFQAHMQVRLVNDGPVTIMCDSES